MWKTLKIHFLIEVGFVFETKQGKQSSVSELDFVQSFISRF